MDFKDEVSAEASRRDMAAENSDAVALTKKRARRVSFAAEMTSVHIFDRDEEFNETPSVAAANMTDDSPAEFGFGGLSERSKEFGGEDDGEYNLEDEVMEMQRSFLRPIGSPSSGGSTLGSASSNDGKFRSVSLFSLFLSVFLFLFIVCVKCFSCWTCKLPYYAPSPSLYS